MAGLTLSTGSGLAEEHLPRDGCGSIYYGDYDPKEPRSLQGIPRAIRAQLLRHIESRVGATLFANVSFGGGQIVDLAALRRVEPDSKDYEWTVPTYNLFFQLRLPGRDVYCASVELDEKGQLLQEITLPNAAKYPSKAQVISREQAAAVAKTHAVPLDKAMVEMNYFPDTDTLEWLFCFHTQEGGATFRGQCLHVPADNQERVHWSEFSGDY